MIRMNDFKSKATVKAAVVVSVLFLFAAVMGFGQSQQVNLTAGPATTTLPDGTVVPMWGYSCGAAVTGSTATCAPLSGTGANSGAAQGAIGGITVLNGGSGYSATPTVTITPAPGTPAPTTPAAASAIVSGGVIVGFNVTSHGAGYTAAPSVTITDTTGTGAVAGTGLAWSPIVITIPTGATTAAPASLQINLTNNLSFIPATGGTANTIPTSIVIVGQVGAGLGSSRTTAASPNHADAQGCVSWFIAGSNVPPGQPCTTSTPLSSPPNQGPRVQSMSTEVAAVAPGTATTPSSLIWANLKPGTYLLESGTHPSIQVPMGLIGMLVVTNAPVGATAGTAYPAVAATTKTAALPAVSYNAEVPLEFSEIDPVQNKAVDLAVRTAGFSETVVWTRMNTPAVTALSLTSGGTGYTAPLSVSITGGGGSGASATATLGAIVSGVAVTNGGTSCVAPAVGFTDATGSGAAATATVVGGVITGIYVTNPGSGYTAPTVTITDATSPTCSSATSTTAATASVAGTYGTVYSVSLTNAGAAYTSLPTVTINTGGATPPTTSAVVTPTVTLGGCGAAHNCYPPAVNYTPFYYLINGYAFDKTNAMNSVFPATAGVSTVAPIMPVTSGIAGPMLVRMVNAGLRMHVPSIVGSQTTGFSGSGTSATVSGFTLVAEDGNVIPNLLPATGSAQVPAPRVQTDVFMAAGKTFDVMINGPATATTAATFPVYDRELSLSANSSVRDAGMLAYIGVNGGGLPAGAVAGLFAAPTANPDFYSAVIPCAAGAASCTPLVVSDASKGVIANDTNVYGVELSTPPTSGTLTCNALPGSPVAGICANGTFTYTPNAGAVTAGGAFVGDSFGYCANGGSTVCTTVTLSSATVEAASGITCSVPPYAAKSATYLKVASPGVLAFCRDAAGYPLHIAASPAATLTGTGATLVTMDAQGGFVATVTSGTTTATLNFYPQNSQGTATTSAQTATINFPTPSNLAVTVVDAQAYSNCAGDSTCIGNLVPITDYRWIIEEDKTFWVDPNCTANQSYVAGSGCPALVGPAGQTTIPTFGVNFHTSNMDYVAQGCTGPLSCEGGQTIVCGVPGGPACPAGTPAGTHVPAVCDVGNGACRVDPTGTTAGTGNGSTWVLPSSLHLDPTKRYYISVLPGDAANPFNPAYLGAPGCNTTTGAQTPGGNPCGHTMGGAPVPPACNILMTGCTSASTTAFAPVRVLVLPTPLPTGKLSVMVFEDDFPLNGEMDGGGGGGVAASEPGLGGFNIVLWDTYGGLGDVTGQNSYDMFNMPLSNSLAGTIDPATNLDACPISPVVTNNVLGTTPGTVGAGNTPASQTGITGMIVTCPKYESDGATLSPLAGQAVIANLMPEKFSVQAYPAADRIARGEEWLQTNTLDGQHAHDSFIRIGEPSYFQEYGPAGYHVNIGFANPKIINDRLAAVCAGAYGAVGACTNTVQGQVDVQRLSRTPDQRLYPSGSRDALTWTQCWVSLGDPDAEDFMFTKCDAQGNFKFTGVPGGEWRITIGDQWNDQIIDGLSTPVNVGVSAAGKAEAKCPGAASQPGSGGICDMGGIGVQQWQSNLYTRVFIDDNKNGIPDNGEIGLPLSYVMIHYRDGHNSNALTTDFNGVANFNETFPLFNWYVVEADDSATATRYKTTGIHTVYDAGGPADGSPSCGPANGARTCGTSAGYHFLANTNESIPLPGDLSVPGAVYCVLADCTNEAGGFAAGTPKPSFPTASTGRLDPPWVGSEAWSGMTGQSNWIEFGKAPFAACNPNLPVTATNFCVSVPNSVYNATAGGTTTNASTNLLVGENGGIHGIVDYASTRPFDDASQMIQQPWEEYVPHVTINLYQEGFAADGVTPTLTLVDTTQTSSWDDWAQGFYPGAAGTLGVTAGSGAGAGQKPYMNCPGQGTATGTNADLFYYTLFDQPNYLDAYNAQHNGGTRHTLPYNSQFKCYDAMHIWNQVQPAPFDGRYSFPSVLGINQSGRIDTTLTGGVGGNGPGTAGYTAAKMGGTNCIICVANPDTSDNYRVGTPMLPPGKYVVEVLMPPGFEVYKEEDKNLLIGDNFIAPATQQFAGLGGSIFIIPDQASVATMYDPTAAGYNPNNFQNQTTSLGLSEELSGVPGFPGFQDPVWPCVGEQRVVPDFLSLFPKALEVAPFAGATRPLCDRKEVTLPDQMSVSAKFFIFTSTHIASKFTGVITDDFTSEFDPFSPQFGEKFAPPNMPISTKDYLGNEISRVYSDHWGIYDGLTFSSWEVNPPNITGYSPTMMVQCMNDPGPIIDTRATIVNSAGASVPNPTFGKLINDPLYNSTYSDFCYEEPYMPGLTTYLDTPVVPTQAFVGAGYNNVDCSYPDTTPAIAEVDGDAIGPWVAGGSGHNTLTINALGDQQVANSAYSGPSASVAPFNMKTVTRHYGFGNTKGTVTIGGVNVVTISSWTDSQITLTVPDNIPLCTVQQQAQYGGVAAQCGQLVITTANTAPAGSPSNAKQSIDTVTVTIENKLPTHVTASQTIQSAIDAASPGDLIIVDPNCTSTTVNGSGSTVTSQTACTKAITSPAPGAPACTPAVGTACTAGAASTHTEMVIMWKPVRLQGVGAASTIINANTTPAGKLLDPWRRHINCLFGLTLQGVPYTGNVSLDAKGNPIAGSGGAAPYDPTGGSSCPDTTNGPWTGFNALPNAPQIDRLPLEAVMGWDSNLNGNVAELLQEPTLMGAYEGAGITVLAKGLDFHGQAPWSDGTEGGAFPTQTTLLTGVVGNPSGDPTKPGTVITLGDANPLCTDGTGGANRFPSNFLCNPSSIDGLTVTNASQGGGGIFIHGWAHYLEVANNRVYNNAGTLSGGISVGQGEFAGPYLVGGTTNAAPGSCSDGTGLVTNQHMPDCFQVHVNLHNNMITQNSSLGDELFSATLAGGGGVSLCTGNDYYKFNYNWICGNLSSGEGGGVVHLGEIFNGHMEHNSILFNQSINPTIPTDGGGIMVQGTPDTDPVCPGVPDSDCPPGLSDGTGHGLVINANLIQGNSADSGSGGGIRLNQVNGTEVSTFPGNYPITAADEGHTVRVQIAAAATQVNVGDSVTIAVTCTPTTACAAYNGTFTVTGVSRPGQTRFFTYLDPTLGLGNFANPAGVGTFTDPAVAAGAAQTITRIREVGAGEVTLTTTLPAADGDTIQVFNLVPTGYNGTHTVTCTPTSVVSTTCPGGPTAAGTLTYNDTNNQLATATINPGPTPPAPYVTDSNLLLASAILWNDVTITNNIIVNNVAGWDGAGISLQDALNVNIVNNTIAHNDSLATSGVLTYSLGAPMASAPAGNCSNAAGTASCAQSSGVTSTPNSSLLTGSLAGLPHSIICPPGHTNCQSFSNPALYNDLIWQNRSYFVGITGSGTGNLNQQNVLALFNAGGSAAAAQTSTGVCPSGSSYSDLGVRGGGFSISTGNSFITDGPSPFISAYCNGSRVPPECTSADGCGGAHGFGVPPGISDAVTPNPLFTFTPNATVDEGNNWINVSWGPLALSDPSIQGPNGNWGGGLALGNYGLILGTNAVDRIPLTGIPAYITVPPTDFFGNPRPNPDGGGSIDAGAVETGGGTAVAPTLTAINPTSGYQGTVVNVTLTGNHLTGATSVNVSGGAANGIAVSGVGVVNDQTVVATFTISAGAPVASRNVSVTTPNGTTGTVSFSVLSTSPTLTSISPASAERGTAAVLVPVTLTGANLSGATLVNISGTGVTHGAFSVNTAGTQITTTFTIAAFAATGTRTVSVTTPIGTSNTVTFRVTGAAVGFAGPTPALNSGGTGTKTGTITVTNTATGPNAAPLTMTAAPSIAKTGSGNGTLTITAASTCTGTTVLSPSPGPGNTCTIVVQYTGETNTSTATGTVTITDTGATTATQTRVFSAN